MRYAKPLISDVADIYTYAAEHGMPPTLTVMEEWDAPRSTAGRWVREARDAGLLPPTKERSPNHTNERLMRVATRLGIAPAVLGQAILEEAGGQVRISGPSAWGDK